MSTAIPPRHHRTPGPLPPVAPSHPRHLKHPRPPLRHPPVPRVRRHRPEQARPGGMRPQPNLRLPIGQVRSRPNPRLRPHRRTHHPRPKRQARLNRLRPLPNNPQAPPTRRAWGLLLRTATPPLREQTHHRRPSRPWRTGIVGMAACSAGSRWPSVSAQSASASRGRSGRESTASGWRRSARRGRSWRGSVRPRRDQPHPRPRRPRLVPLGDRGNPLRLLFRGQRPPA